MNIFHTRHTAHTTQSLNTRQSVKHVPVFVLYYTEKFIFYTRHTTYTFQSVKHVPVFLLYYTEWYIFHTRRTAHTTQNVNTLQSVKHVPVPLPYYIELYIVYTRQNYSYHSDCEYPSEKEKKRVVYLLHSTNHSYLSGWRPKKQTTRLFHWNSTASKWTYYLTPFFFPNKKMC